MERNTSRLMGTKVLQSLSWNDDKDSSRRDGDFAKQKIQQYRGISPHGANFSSVYIGYLNISDTICCVCL